MSAHRENSDWLDLSFPPAERVPDGKSNIEIIGPETIDKARLLADATGATVQEVLLAAILFELDKAREKQI